MGKLAEYRKGIAALITLIVVVLRNVFDVQIPDLDEGAIDSIAVGIGTLLVVMLPNRPPSGGVSSGSVMKSIVLLAALLIPACGFGQNIAPIGSAVTIAADATDAETGVRGVVFNVDGVPIAPEDTATPYTTQWVTAGFSPGDYTLTATACDNATSVGMPADNCATSDPVVVTLVTGDTNAPSVVITITITVGSQ